jgi:hypothetical protein
MKPTITDTLQLLMDYGKKNGVKLTVHIEPLEQIEQSGIDLTNKNDNETL